MDTLYRYFLALHIVAVISWMAGILYLYRLFVYHAEETENVVKERFIVMERRLYRFITTPAMWLSIAMGTAMLAVNPSLLEHHWMRAKLFCVFFLIGITQMAGPMHRKLASGESKKTSKTFRILNEVPTLLMIAIVFLVILKPF